MSFIISRCQPFSGSKGSLALLSELPPSPPEARDRPSTVATQRDRWGNRPDDAAYGAIITHKPFAPLKRIGRQARDYRRQVHLSWNEFVPWLRSGMQRSQRPSRRAFNIMLSLILLVALFTCSIGSVIGVAADYFSLKGLADSGLAALEHVPEDLGLGSHVSTHVITDQQRAQALVDVDTALDDFQQLHQRLIQPDLAISIGMHFPKTDSLLQSAFLLSGVALDAVQIVKKMFDTIIAFANVYVSSPLLANASSTQVAGGLSPADFTTMQTEMQNAMPYLTDLLTRLQMDPPNVLFAALSGDQQAKIMPLLQVVPKIPAVLPIIQQFIAAAPIILGVGQPAAYLIMTMDPAEMRATGGFQGNYAVLNVRAGRLSNVTLQDVYQLDHPYNTSWHGENDTPPSQYLSWWPREFLPWGLRDANLSPDFPTSAAYDLRELEKENGERAPVTGVNGVSEGTQQVTVTGLIAIEPTVIQQMLQLTGPITIGAPFNEVITADNFEARIHYYQLTNQGRKTSASSSGPSSTNKRFTSLLAHTLLARVKALPKDKLISYLGMLLTDLHTKDIQVAFSNPTAEAFLRMYQLTSELYTGSADSLMLVDSNISGNKASQFLAEQITDNVQLDGKGGATHTLSIHYDWAPPPIQDGTNPDEVYSVLYNADSAANYGLFYRQYTRIYTAQNPSVQAASGWQFGGIDTTVSDLPGRGMLGAYYILQGDATTHPVSWSVPDTTVTWYVPNVYTPGQPYALHFQRQAGAQLSLMLTVTGPTCGSQAAATQSFTVNTVTMDQVFSVPTTTCQG
jgi:hypothetical protein